MKKTVLKHVLFVCFATALLILPGCSNPKNKYKNLDLGETVVIENVPESGVWKSVRFKNTPYLTPETADSLKKAAGGFGIFNLDTKNILYDVRVESHAPYDEIPYSEMSEEQYQKAEYMRYIADDLYIDYCIVNRILFFNKKTFREIKGADYDSTWGWMPGFGKEPLEKSYTISAGDEILDSYNLNNSSVSINDAMKFAAERMNSGELPYITSKLFTYTPIRAEVYKMNENSYAYSFDFSLNFDGVPLDSSNSSDLSVEDTAPIFSTTVHTCMFTPNSIDWVWSSVLNFEEAALCEDVEIAVDYDEACRILSEKLSQESVFKIYSAELLYGLCGFKTDDLDHTWTNENVVEPFWQFKCSSGTQEYGIVYADVNAVTGEIYLRRAL